VPYLNPEDKRRSDRATARRRRARRQGVGPASDPAELVELPPPPADHPDEPITADEIRRILGRELRGAEAIGDAYTRSRVVASLASAAMRAIEVSDLAARVAAVERIMRARRPA
jgi:hypothetical protein